MTIHPALTTTLTLALTLPALAQDKPAKKPAELEVLKASVGVWDAHIEVWPMGPEKESIKFKGVDTIRPYGEYWIASDFDSTYMGQTTKVHSIIGYDLDKKKLVGIVIDHGPYKANMTGEYDKKTKTVRWVSKFKGPNGKPMTQRAVMTHKKPEERVLVLKVPGQKQGQFTKFMQIRYVKRKK